MTPEDWQRVRELCQQALDQRPEERIAFLASACPDERIRHEVEGLLAHATEGAGIMVPLWNQAGIGVGDTLPFVRSDPGIPPAFGPYRILERVGEGGMGVVYKAVQDRPHRVVALKVIKPGLTTSELLRRFEREANALARLQHPGIAQIYEVGTVQSSAGPMPYFAMEYIDGSPLRSYADSHHLDGHQRLELIARVCDAVEHAHQRGIIHRDLKPNNILIDESGQPKILDFGVARITDSDDHATKQTDMGQVIGTLAYMSPEQVLADPFELDTRSDVYALGVILYELLAGRLPYRVSGTLIEAARAIQEQEPARLSSIDRRHRGDVETIAAKALEKNKERRYSSAAALGADIRRYLTHEPIEARPATTAYQLRKFARRHTALVASTAVVFTVLIVGIAFSMRAAAKARAAELTAQAVNDFLRNDLLAQANVALQSGPATKPDPDLKVRTALDRAAAQISGKFEGQPAVEAAIRDTIGLTYLDLGIYAPARVQLERALDLRRRTQGGDDPESLRTLSQLARTAFFESKYPEAERLFTQAMDAQRRTLGPGHVDTLASMTGLATVYDYAGKHTLAEELIRTVLDIQRRSLGPDDPSVLRAMSTLQGIYMSQGNYADAESSGVQLLAADRRVRGQEHPETLAAMNNLANVYLLQGKYTQAETLYGETLQIYRRVFGTENSKTLSTLQNLANAYGMLGKYAAAEAVLQESLDIQRRVTGPEHSDTLHAMVNLADALYLQGKYDAAEGLLSKVLDAFRRTQGPEHPRTLIVLADMALMYQLRGTYDRAEEYASAALTGRRHALGPTHPMTIASAADLALALLSQGKFTDSEPLAREAVEFTRKNQPNDWERYRAETLLGASLAGQQKFADAEPLLVDGYQGMLARKERMGVPNWYYLDRAGEWILQLYQAWDKPAQTTEWRRKLKS